MTLPISGSISLSQVNTELGLSSTATITLNDTNVRRLAMVSSGAIAMSDLRGATAILSSTTNLNLFTLAGSPSTASTYKFTIFPGVIIGGSGTYALNVGQFPTGSTIYIDNYGSIQGYGGAANSGVGGSAVYASYANQTVVINNMAGATIYGGGGGGGAGGTGGTGGMGYYVVTTALGSTGCAQPYTLTCDIVFGAGAYGCGGGTDYSCGSFILGFGCSACYRDSNAYTYGGSGGAGGAGGVGQGYGQAASSGASGSAGAAGGINAGAGGTGGSGGAGGVWGTAGSAGSTGGTGASGNYTGGSAGTGGAGAGAAGNYLIKGSNAVTLNNYGTVAGGLA